MGTSWVAVSINNITTRASREMTSRKNIKIVYFNGVNLAKHWHVAGEVFAMFQVFIQRSRSTKNIILINIQHPNNYLQINDCDVILKGIYFVKLQ